jgi:hypothetical protein
MTFTRTAGFLAAAAVAVTAGCAPQAGEPGQVAAAGRDQCFLPSQVAGFSAVDDDTVNVFVGANDVYSLDLAGPCPNVDWSLQIGIRSTGGGSWVCGGLDAELLVPDVSGMGTNRCMVTNIQKLSPEAAQAARAARGS